jgi:hypothetical protein
MVSLSADADEPGAGAVVVPLRTDLTANVVTTHAAVSHL